MRYFLTFILCLFGLSVQAVQFQAFTNANTIWVDSNGSDSGNNKGVKGVPEKPFQTIQGANTVANPGDWVIVTGATIQTNNLLKAGVNYDIYPQIIFMETSLSTGGYGIFDDRSIPGGTTNIIICHEDIKHSGGTNFGRLPYLGNDNVMGCIVTTNANTRLWFRGKDIYGSDYDATTGSSYNTINVFAGSEDSYFEFNSIYSFATNMVGTNQFGTPGTAPDGANAIQVYSNGCKMVCHGEITPFGTYAINSTSADPNINANFYFDGAARLNRKIYFAWTSPNWRAWMNFKEINSPDGMAIFGGGKVYITCQKASSDSGSIVSVQTSSGASNIDVWITSDKFEAKNTCTGYADSNAGKLTLNVKTYTNLTTSVTAGFSTVGGNLVVNGGEMYINGQQNFGAYISGGTNTFKGLKIFNALVNHAGNNAITNAGGVLQLEGCKFVVPPLAQAIAAGSAVTVGNMNSSSASNTNSSNVTLSPNAGFTVDTLIK